MRRLAPQTGTGLVLSAGQTLTVVDPTGGQVSDFFAFSAHDHGEWLSSGRTIDYNNKVFLTTGDVLYSNRSTPMATIIKDTCGQHDFMLTPCSQQTFDLLYPEFNTALAHPASPCSPRPSVRARPQLTGTGSARHTRLRTRWPVSAGPCRAT